MPYWDHTHTHAWGWGWFGAMVVVVAMVLFWGGLGTIVYLVVRRTGHGVPRDPGRTPEQILDERFARGEIDEDELMARRAALRGGTTR